MSLILGYCVCDHVPPSTFCEHFHAWDVSQPELLLVDPACLSQMQTQKQPEDLIREWNGSQDSKLRCGWLWDWEPKLPDDWLPSDLEGFQKLYINNVYVWHLPDWSSLTGFPPMIPHVCKVLGSNPFHMIGLAHPPWMRTLAPMSKSGVWRISHKCWIKTAPRGRLGASTKQQSNSWNPSSTILP